MSLPTWTVTTDIVEAGIRRRGLLIGRFELEEIAPKEFTKLVGLQAQAVVSGLSWSEVSEFLLSHEAWNALTCEDFVRGGKIFAVARVDIPEPQIET
ncbi:hypothetical protein ABT392_00435 [Paucibacter sp. JuS9]|uniref:hypothetical protein n=1 Tax=Paucibacter sp. JuS9 TaxID=3228748 RepID=UPI0037574C0A